jgi:hypothetical protein
MMAEASAMSAGQLPGKPLPPGKPAPQFVKNGTARNGTMPDVSAVSLRQRIVLML